MISEREGSDGEDGASPVELRAAGSASSARGSAAQDLAFLAPYCSGPAASAVPRWVQVTPVLGRGF